jgi:chromatin structure-remodeling complex subunit RSC9
MLIAEIALRQQPPQRVLFGAAQDSAGRQTRGSANHNSPTPGSNTVNGTYGANGAAFTIANYEPRQPHASTMKPVTTPANNPDYFRSHAKRLLAARKSAHGYLQPRGPMMLPGSKLFPSLFTRRLLTTSSRFHGTQHLRACVARPAVRPACRSSVRAPSPRQNLP